MKRVCFYMERAGATPVLPSDTPGDNETLLAAYVKTIEPNPDCDANSAIWTSYGCYLFGLSVPGVVNSGQQSTSTLAGQLPAPVYGQ